ncbi:MAG: twin-arginine translocase TatA/TatE family subunit [Opitutales bacterium]|jgi:sec-independent protein translocase protein TatA
MNFSNDPILAMLSGWEIFIIALVLLLLFGAKRLPELFRSMGKATKEFQKARTEVEGDIRTVMSQDSAIDHQHTDQQVDETHSETVSEHEKEHS